MRCAREVTHEATVARIRPHTVGMKKLYAATAKAR